MICNLTNNWHLSYAPTLILCLSSEAWNSSTKWVQKDLIMVGLGIYSSHFIEKIREMQSSTWIGTNEISLTQMQFSFQS